EIHKALVADAIVPTDLVELGAIIGGDINGRTSDEQITVADLTGVAVQDIQIANAVVRKLSAGVSGAEAE
ncbi:MAG: ornithine cyclodeaminase family protein, partial [Acidobacteriota bacterium]